MDETSSCPLLSANSLTRQLRAAETNSLLLFKKYFSALIFSSFIVPYSLI
jgi:hypothetical protein